MKQLEGLEFLKIKVVLVVDKGFQDLLLPSEYFEKSMPPFLMQRTQFEIKEIEDNQHQQALRFIVECMNRLLKGNGILHHAIQNQELDKADDYVQIATALANKIKFYKKQ
jgi:hypothetical protein